MAADIHTKGFKNPLAWNRACMLINLLDPGDLCTKELSDLVKPTTDVDATVRQVFQSRTKEVPNFPYTEKPLFCHLSCIKRVYQPKNKFNSSQEWIPFWS